LISQSRGLGDVYKRQGKLQATMVTNNKNKKPLKLFFILQSFII
jgi:hypothetical protein